VENSDHLPGSRLSACGALVERHDRDRYLASLFAAEPEREALFALYAFNHEVAKTAEVVSEPMLGEIRLQWWREAIAGIYEGRPRHHEVVLPLAEAVAAKALPRELLERIVDARAFDLDPAPPATLEALRGYAEGSSTALLLLALHILGACDAASREAAEQLGPAWAYLGLLRALPLHARQKRSYLPADLCAEAGVDLQEVFELRTSPTLLRVSGILMDGGGKRPKLMFIGWKVGLASAPPVMCRSSAPWRSRRGGRRRCSPGARPRRSGRRAGRSRRSRHSPRSR
jgi:NADH dehydrogenase [ubiquinone] 1 alpha subcomplex assembly factor 6